LLDCKKQRQFEKAAFHDSRLTLHVDDQQEKNIREVMQTYTKFPAG
jgi:hypothetical protein